MSTPSIKTIESRLGDILRKEYGDNLKNELTTIRNSMFKADSHNRIDQALDSINNILGGYGVEAIRDNKWSSYYCDIGLLYVNLGDTYTPTVIYDTRSDKWIIASWGDIVERNEKRFNV